MNVFFEKYKHYFLFSFAFFISSIGTSFTTVAVYARLSDNQASASMYTLAFAAGILPGLFTSIWAGRKSNTLPMYNIIMFAFGASLISLIVPAFGFKTNNVYLFLIAEVISSMATGLLVPFCKAFEKRTFEDQHLKFLAAYDTVFFTAVFILGQGLGSILISYYSWETFLVIDALTYVMAMVIMTQIRPKLLSHTDTSSDVDFVKPVYSKVQTDTLYLYIWIPLICAPLMAVIPTVGAKFDRNTFYNIKPELLLLCARTLGQILGPIVTLWIDAKKLNQKSNLLFLFLGCFVMLYSLSFYLSNLLAIFLFIILAHMFSNIALTMANFRFLQNFNEHEIGYASSWTYRYATLTIGTSALVAGFILDAGGFLTLIFISVLLFTLSLLLNSKMNKTNKRQIESSII